MSIFTKPNAASATADAITTGNGDDDATLGAVVGCMTGARPFGARDGSYLAEFLLRKNYMVHGIIRRSSSFNTGRIEDLYQVRPPRPARLP